MRSVTPKVPIWAFVPIVIDRVKRVPPPSPTANRVDRRMSFLKIAVSDNPIQPMGSAKLTVRTICAMPDAWYANANKKYKLMGMEPRR